MFGWIIPTIIVVIIVVASVCVWIMSQFRRR
jgi:hypothetical protein